MLTSTLRGVGSRIFLGVACKTHPVTLLPSFRAACAFLSTTPPAQQIPPTPALLLEEEEDDEDDGEMVDLIDPDTGEWGGPTRGGSRPEPTRFGDWSKKITSPRHFYMNSGFLSFMFRRAGMKVARMVGNGVRFSSTLPSNPKVGFIGMGVMGQSMAGHLLEKYDLTIYSRTASKCEGLAARGATLVSSPFEVGERSDVVVSIVGYPSDVRSVLLGEEGALQGLRPGGIVVDMTTSEPMLAKEIAAVAAEKGCGAVDAPVSGGDVGAKAGTLSIMCGGEREHVESVMPLLECMGQNIRHMGPAGAGQSTKCVNQILVASSMVGATEALLFAEQAGLDLDETIAAVGAGAAGSWTINNLGPRIAKGDYEPGFYVEHFLKDLGIVLSESRAMGLSIPGTALAEQLYQAVRAQGHHRKGTQALMLALKTLNNKK